MAIPVTLVNVGSFPNDSTGDPAQVAFTKINSSLTSLSVNAAGGNIAVSSPDATLSITVNGNNLALSAGPLNVLPGTYSYAGLPAASTNSNKLATTTDKGAVFSNGAFWEILYNPTSGTLAISTNSPLPPAAQSVAYSLPLTATGGVGGLTWQLVSAFGATNAWTLSGAGTLSATPGTIATDNLMLQVTDSTGAVAQKLVTIQTSATLTPAATPTFSPVAGNYTGSQSVTISDTTPTPTLYYTTNGSTPTTGSTVYTTPVTVSVNTTIKAICTAPGFTQSAVGSAAYTFGTVANTLGINFAAGGSGQLSYEGFPIFQDMFRCGRYVCNFTASLATTGVLSVSALGVSTGNNIALGTFIQGAGISGYTYILAQLTGTTGGIGTYQTNVTGTVVGSEAMNTFGTTPITLDANGWPTTDFQFLLWEGGTGLSWQTAGTGKFACGFTSKGTGTESVTAVSGCTISGLTHVGTAVSFDLTFTSGAVQFSVTGTTGGVTNLFCYLPAYRATTYSAASLFTTEAVTHYSQYGHLRPMEYLDQWNNSGYLLPFTANAAIGATSATLNVPFAFSTKSYNCMFLSGFNSNNQDIRAISLTNTGTAITWTGALTQIAYGIFIPNSSANRNTPAKVKCFQGWGVTDGFPLEWMLDFCVACGNLTPYINLPINDDGTYQSAVGTLLNGTYPTLKGRYEIANEIWGGSGAKTVCNSQLASAIYNPLSLVQADYMAVLYRNLATNMKTAYGANFASNCLINMCWQTQGNGKDFFYTALAYYVAQGWTPSADLKSISVAPYYNLTNTSFTASIANTGVMTVTGFSGNEPVLAVGATITGTGVTGSPTIASQLTGTPFGIGTYQLSTTGITVASETMTAAMALSSTIAQIQTNLTALAPYAAPLAGYETFAAIAFANGLQVGTYEGGWQVNAENNGLTNGGAAQLDSGFTAIENSHKQAVYNSGASFYTAMESGTHATGGNLAPVLELTNSFPPTVANSPKFASHVAFSGAITPTKNVVNGTGSVIQGYNYCDNLVTANLGNFNLGSFTIGPYYHSNGYCAWIINVTVAGTYNLDVTFSGVTGSPQTSVQIDTAILATAVAVSNGVVRVKAGAVLSLGPHVLVLGQNGAQTAFVTQIQMN